MGLLRRRAATGAYPPDPEPADLIEPDPPADPAEPADVFDEEGPTAEALPPSRMRGTEPLYGYVVALELLVVAVLNVVVRTGKGAPAHPQTTLQLLGIVASVAFLALIRVRNRTIVGLGAIVAAFFVTLPKVPNSLSLPHILALVGPLAYGLIVTQRQRRAIGNTARSGRRGATGSAGARNSRPARDTRNRRDTSNPRSPSRNSRRRGAQAPIAGPRPSARYTPPKAKRGGGPTPKR